MGNAKCDLMDFSFLLLVRIDSRERQENLAAVITYLLTNFNTQIHLIECDSISRINFQIPSEISYDFIKDDNKILHTTRYRNHLIKNCKTTNFFIYDVDVVISKEQIKEAATLIRENKNSLVYPYDGKFFNVSGIFRNLFIKTYAIQILESNVECLTLLFPNSIGAVFGASKSFYIICGLENEHLYGWGPDDKERFQRVAKLEYQIFRTKGLLFHLDHPRGINSHFPPGVVANKNYQEYLRIVTSSRDQLINYINTWNWL
ncbi:hypothetical protein SAMN05216490_3464 [Mucilaginibacter mallensis]|uniref:Uncharacterized protein n=1 Tax=Mucilaginibacter mallensis TaxID=652787 RepID=A0A1H2ABR1_MUCMA|nr:galactosyltransferase-related protein [Mucilaginibacter mallensis]SDT43353.1 hypothetical protein SAMN05216490_3464 [Mucilaginibacter mallensis]